MHVRKALWTKTVVNSGTSKATNHVSCIGGLSGVKILHTCGNITMRTSTVLNPTPNVDAYSRVN